MRAASPRLTAEPTPWRSLVIHGGVLLLWVALFARAFLANGVFAWSTGLVYIAYDTALLAFVFVRTLGLVRQPSPAPGTRRVTLGVIIAAHNEAAVLPTTLAAMAAQADPAELVVIADDGSSDATCRRPGRRNMDLQPPPFGIVEPSPAPSTRLCAGCGCTHGGKARALNAAMVCIDTEMVLTVDADTHLDPGALVAMRAAFAAAPSIGCGDRRADAHLRQFGERPVVRDVPDLRIHPQLPVPLRLDGDGQPAADLRRIRRVPPGGGGGEVGGFDTECLVEDYELIHRLRRHATLDGA